MELSKIENVIEEMKEDFEVIAMPRSKYVLENLVVKVHEHITQQWLQCVLEMRIKYNEIRRSLIKIKILDSEIDDSLQGQLKVIDREDLEWYVLGLMREFFALYDIYKQFPRFTREDIEKGQAEYWYNRLVKQATQDILSQFTKVSVGNQEGLRQIEAVVSHTIGDNGRLVNINHGKTQKKIKDQHDET